MTVSQSEQVETDSQDPGLSFPTGAQRVGRPPGLCPANWTTSGSPVSGGGTGARRGTSRIQPGARGQRGGAGPAGARPARRPIAAGPPGPGGLGQPPPPERAAAAPTRQRRAGRRARSVWRRRPCADRRARSAAAASNRDAPRRRAAPARPPPWWHGSSPGWWCKWPSSSRPFLPSPPSPAPGPRAARAPAAPAPVVPAINTRRPLNLAGTVAAEVAGERAAQNAAAALRGPARARGPGGRGREGWGARGFAGVRVEPRPAALFPRLVGLVEAPSECAAGTRVPLLGKKCWPGVARCRAPPPRFCQVKMTEPRRAWGAAWRDRRGEGRRAGGRAPKRVEKYSSFLGFSN